MSIYGTIKRVARGRSHRGYSFANQKLVLAGAIRCRDAYYAVNVVAAFLIAKYLWEQLLVTASPIPNWVTFWVDSENFRSTTTAINVLLLASAVAVATWPASRLLRVLAACGTLLAAALANTSGAINHWLHIWLWISLVFTLFPNADDDRVLMEKRLRLSAITTVWIAQGLIALFYTLSGIYKVKNAFPASPDLISSFSPNALSAHIAGRMTMADMDTMFGAVAVEYPYLLWPIFLSVLYLELFALVAWLRPSVHRIWGLSLIAFHIGIWSTMSIHFPFQPVQALILFVWSPFNLSAVCWRERLYQMPLVGILAKAVTQRSDLALSDLYSDGFGIGIIICVGLILIAGSTALFW